MYRAFFVSALQTGLAYRSRVWALLLHGLVTTFAKIALWLSLYAQTGTGSVDGASRADMLTYAVLASVLFNWNYTGFVRTVGQQIKSGDVAVFLLKPVRYPLMLFAVEAGNLVFALLTVQLPITIIAALIYGLSPPSSPFAGWLALVCWSIGFLILFLLSAIAAILAFWLLTVFSLEWTLMALLGIFAGGAIPLWFFPPAANEVIRFLPFSYVAYQPMAVYLGKVNAADSLLVFGVGVMWIAVLIACVLLLWSRAQSRIVVHGG